MLCFVLDGKYSPVFHRVSCLAFIFIYNLIAKNRCSVRNSINFIRSVFLLFFYGCCKVAVISSHYAQGKNRHQSIKDDMYQFIIIICFLIHYDHYHYHYYYWPTTSKSTTHYYNYHPPPLPLTTTTTTTTHHPLPPTTYHHHMTHRQCAFLSSI